MSKTNLFAALVAVGAGALGAAAYHKASILEQEVHHPKPTVVDRSDTEALAQDVRRLEARVAELEARARTREGSAPAAPSPAPAPAADPDLEPVAAPDASGHPADVGQLPKDAAQREVRKERMVKTIDAFWKEWATKNGLSPTQTESLCAIEVEAAKRKLDNQARMADHEITQPQARVDNQAATDEVRRKAQGLLTPAQFAQFEADKGAEWGSSYRRVREMHDKGRAAP